MKLSNVLLLLVIFALVSLLTACPGATLQTQQQDIAGICSVIAGAEDVIAIANSAGKVPASVMADVDKVIKIKAAVCNVTPEPTSIDAALYASLEGAASTLAADAVSVRAKQ